MSDDAETSPSIVGLTADIVSSYVSANKVAAADLPGLINTVFGALSTAGEEDVRAVPVASIQQPTAAQIRKSIKPDGLISFEDGKSYRMLKRHLAGHDLTPMQYRAKWGLPLDYPMSAPSYAAMRSAIAKAARFGLRTQPNRATSKPARPPKTAKGRPKKTS